MAQPVDNTSPSTAINDSDHGALVRVTAAFCAALMLLSLCARLQIRWPWRSLFDRDDICAVVASTFALTQMVVIVYSVSKGFGKLSQDLSPAAIDTVHKAVYASDILFVVALFLAKLAVGLLYKRLSSDPKLVRVANALVITSAVFTFLAAILAIIPTSSTEPWKYGQDAASGKFDCWAAITAMSVLIELGLLAFPIWLVKGLQMRRSPKVLIVLAAWLRLPLIPVSILRLLSIRSNITGQNFTFDYTNTEVYTQVEMTFALLNATMLCLHNFLRFANSGVSDLTVGTGGAVTTLYGTGNSSHGKSKEHPSKKPIQRKGFDSVKMASLGRQNTSSVMRADSLSIASDSSQRNIMVRHTVDVQYGRPEGVVGNCPLQPEQEGGKF